MLLLFFNCSSLYFLYLNTDNTTTTAIKIIAPTVTPMINPIFTELQQSVVEVLTGSIKTFAYAETKHFLAKFVFGQV